MRRLAVSSYQTVPWKNGGGLTREIATHSDAKGLIWRLSLADVTSDAPYSRFPGYHRILTVVTGGGTQLLDADNVVRIDALPYEPVPFSGDQFLQGRLGAGPIQNFNVIFDPKRILARVLIIETGLDMDVPSGAQAAVFCLGDPVTVTELDGTGTRPLHLHHHETCIAIAPQGRPRLLRATGRHLCVTLAPVTGGT
jgi:uncharacterized protein